MTKEYLSFEMARNKKYAPLFNAIMQRAMGLKTDVLCGHHLCFELNGDINTENEIPSADTLLFDHDVMGAVFGRRAHAIMVTLATRPAEERDALLQEHWDEMLRREAAEATRTTSTT